MENSLFESLHGQSICCQPSFMYESISGCRNVSRNHFASRNSEHLFHCLLILILANEVLCQCVSCSSVGGFYFSFLLWSLICCSHFPQFFTGIYFNMHSLHPSCWIIGEYTIWRLHVFALDHSSVLLMNDELCSAFYSFFYFPFNQMVEIYYCMVSILPFPIFNSYLFCFLRDLLYFAFLPLYRYGLFNF